MESKKISAVHPAIKSAAILACLATLTACYFSNTPLPFFLVRLREIGVALLIFWSAAGIGYRALVRTEGMTEGEILIFSGVLGFGALSTAMVALGAVGGWIPLIGWALVLSGLAASGPLIRRVRVMIDGRLVGGSLPASSVLPALAVLSVGLTTGVLAFAPVTYYDSLVYHLAMPAAYTQAGHWLGMPHLIYSAFPQTLEMLWTLCLLIGNDIVGNLVGWGLSLLLLSAVIAFGKRFMDAQVGWLAAALLGLMPAFLLLTSGGYIDMGLVLFSFMALYAACLWSEMPSYSRLAIAGLFAGWAAGTKYTGALPALLTGLWIAAAPPRPLSDRLRDVAVFGLSMLAVFGPWLIKNMIYVGNPVFPFFYRWGVQTLNPWIHEAAAGYFAGITEYYARPLWQLPAVLWDAAVNGIQFGRGIDVLGDFGWLPLLAFLPALWLCRSLSTVIRALLIFCGIFLIPWALSHPVLRFLLPVAPLLALLSAHAWTHGIKNQPAWVRWPARGFLAAFLASGGYLFFFITGQLNAFSVPLGQDTPDHYLSRRLNYYGAAQFVNSQLPADSRIFVFGDQRGYYYRRPSIISPAFSKNPVIEWANAADSPQHLHDRLRQEGITHLVVNRAEFKRLQAYRYSSFDARGQRIWDRLQQSLPRLYRDQATDVYAL